MPNHQSNTPKRTSGFLVLAGFGLLLAAAIVLPFYNPGYPAITIFSQVIGVLGVIFSFVQAFPGFIPKLAFPRIQRSTALLALALILSLALNAFFFTRQGPKTLPILTSSPSTISSPSATAPTPSTISSPSAAAPTPTQANNTFPSYIPGHGTLVMYDPMVDNSRGYRWETLNTLGTPGPSNPGSCQFAADGYHLKADNNYFGCLEYYRGDLKNFVFEVQLTPRSGSAGGLSFRDAANELGYYVDVSPSGYYSISSPKSQDTPDLRSPIQSPLIFKGQKSYLVDIEASGNQITLYVDKKEIYSVTDNTSSHGYLGLYVTLDAGDVLTSHTEAIFTNVKVWNLL